MIDAEALKAKLAKGDSLDTIINDVLSETICEVLSLEANAFIESFNGSFEGGRRCLVRNGYSKLEVLTSAGPVEIKRPRVRDISGSEEKISFESSLLPRYLRRTEHVEEFIPWLYLQGLPVNKVGEALSRLYGQEVKGLSSTSISRLIEGWESEYDDWTRRPIEGVHPYIWADGVFFKVRSERDNQCILAIVGAREDGHKELLGIGEGFAESQDSWKELLVRLRGQGLQSPRLAIGDAGLGLWSGLREVFPECNRQNCWFHAIQAVRNYLPKCMRSLAVAHLKNIYLAPTVRESEHAIKVFSDAYGKKYPKAVETIVKNQDYLLTFYGYPAAHWLHIRTNNPIESLFGTVRHRTSKTRGMVPRRSLGAMVYKLCESAAANFRRLNQADDLIDVVKGRGYKDGCLVEK
jgi:transposase-like protein